MKRETKLDELIEETTGKPIFMHSLLYRNVLRITFVGIGIIGVLAACYDVLIIIAGR